MTYIPAIFSAPILGGFFTRVGGVSTGDYASLNVSTKVGDDPAHVAENRRRVLAEVGGTHLVMVHQVHGKKVVVATPENVSVLGEMDADAIVTATPGLLLGITTADCVPVLIADSGRGVVAAVHCGWRSAFEGILPEVMAVMQKLGANPQRLQAAVGPAIQQPSYEVSEAFYDAFMAQDAANDIFFVRHGGQPTGALFFDLPSYVVAAAHAAGIPTVDRCLEDTYTQPERFFSHRYALQKGIQRGCQISVIGVHAG